MGHTDRRSPSRQMQQHNLSRVTEENPALMSQLIPVTTAAAAAAAAAITATARIMSEAVRTAAATSALGEIVA